MKNTLARMTTLGLLSASILVLASCKSDKAAKAPDPTVAKTEASAHQHGVPGGFAVETYTATANVTAVNKVDRTVTVLTADGRTEVLKCGPGVANFDQINVGDQVKAVFTEELAVSMAPQPSSMSDSEAGFVALSPKGEKPAAVLAGTVQVTATVIAIDVAHHKATLQFSDGSTHVVAVRPDVDLTSRKVGEKVYIRVTQALAISVEKP